MRLIPEEEEQVTWEVHNDDGFVYKIRKDRSSGSKAADEVSRDDLEADDIRRRREIKRKALLSLKARYQEDLGRWKNLSESLTQMQEKAMAEIESQSCSTSHDVGESSSCETPVICRENPEDDSWAALDPLLLQLDAQDAMIRKVSNLCDLAEAMCNAHDQRFAQSIMELPIWSSPRELMTSLCDD